MAIILIQFCVSHTRQNKTKQKNKEKQDIMGNMDRFTNTTIKNSCYCCSVPKSCLTL